jgi:signal transduction histidine kinase
MVNPIDSSTIPFSTAQFDAVFPFHVSFRRDGRIADVGRSVGKLSATVRPGVAFADAFAPKRPEEPFAWERLAAAAGRLYTIREYTTGVVLRGQFMVLDEKMFFLGTPWLADTGELQTRGLTLDDFPAHDPTLDLLQLLQLQQVVAEDLHHLTARLKAKSAQVAEAARAKDAFLASVSHELRTPLTGILGMSEILAEQVHGTLNEQQLRDVKIVHTSGSNLLKLINDIIDLAKMGAGQIELKRETCPIEGFCGPAFERARAAAKSRGQRISFTNDAPGAQVSVDLRRMTEVLGRLLGNAAKFTAEGGEFGLRVTATLLEVRFEVWDRGIGIEVENIAKLFQPFVQLDGRLARRYDGTGLGLALVKQWVDLHGGRIAVESERGAGSRFSVVLARVGGGGQG